MPSSLKRSYADVFSPSPTASSANNSFVHVGLGDHSHPQQDNDIIKSEPGVVEQTENTAEEMEVENTAEGIEAAVDYETPFANSIGMDLVEIHVGKPSKIFHVHKKQLYRKIPTLREKLENNGGDSSNQLEFPDTNPETFDILIEWIYTNRIRRLYAIKDDNGADCDDSWDSLELYILAENLDLETVMDRAMDLTRNIDRKTDWLREIADLERIYKKCSHESLLKDYLLELLLWELRAGSERATSDLVPLFQNEDFVRDFIEISRNKDISDPREVVDCEYHKHTQQEICPVKKFNRKGGRKMISRGSSFHKRRSNDDLTDPTTELTQ